MALLTLRDIRKAYSGRELFDDVALNVLDGKRIGLVGANRAEKTTLLRIIAGLEEPDGGERVAQGQEVASGRGAAVGGEPRRAELDKIA